MKKSLLLAVASLAVISCSKREIGPADPNSDPNLVRFSSGVKSKVTTSPADAKGNVFEIDDEIGVYAVLHGKTIEAGDAFPANTALQYKNKTFKVSAVEADAPYTASFAATAADQKIYYLPGGQGYNYYAYYPTANLSGKMMNNTFVFEDTGNSFLNQTSLFNQGSDLTITVASQFPGPMMYAYYATEDKAATGGATQQAVPLAFKIANAKITLKLEMDEAAGSVEDITSIELYAAKGIRQGYSFDLKQADESTPAVVKQQAAGALLDGSGSGTSALSYKFQNLIDVKAAAGVTTTKSHVVGYLIPATDIENAVIRITKGSGNQAEVFKAYLDQSATGPNSAASGTNYLAKIEAGKAYEFVITISKEPVKFTATIEDWTLVDNSSNPIPAE